MKKWLSFVAFMLILCLGGCGTQTAEAENFQFDYHGVSIPIHGKASPILAKLGEPRGYTETASCAFDGVERTYFYGSFYLSTYPQDGESYISGIWFVDDQVETQENLRIGSSREDVEAALGTDCSADGNSFTCTRGNSRLTILLENNVVTAIRYDALIS